MISITKSYIYFVLDLEFEELWKQSIGMLNHSIAELRSWLWSIHCIKTTKMNLISNLPVTDSIKTTFGVFCKYLFHLMHCPISSGYNKWHVCTFVLFNSRTRLIKIKPISLWGKMHVSFVSFLFTCRKLQNIRIAKSNNLG